MHVSPCQSEPATWGGTTQDLASPFPADMVLTPNSRWPTRLSEATVQAVLSNRRPASRARSVGTSGRPRASIVVVTFNGLVFNRLCLESLLTNTDYPDYEVIVVDNGSSDGTVDYLHALVRDHPHVR